MVEALASALIEVDSVAVVFALVWAGVMVLVLTWPLDLDHHDTDERNT